MTARSHSRATSAVQAVTLDSGLDPVRRLDGSDENGHGERHDEDQE